MTYVIAEPCADLLDKAGSPGGAAKVGKTGNDPHFIKNLPQQAEGH